MPTFKLEQGSLQAAFQESRKKLQIFGGGFANGKTAGMCVKALKIGEAYEGANILLARSTYPKLNDTLRKEFLKWCPTSWIKRKALSQDNIVELKNGTTYNFRYISQDGKKHESSTSNLLSATYDLMCVDQIEDPEIVRKDFDDLFGRLRGSAPYRGKDATMPSTGPRWFLASCNPTRNWVYQDIVKPYHDYTRGIYNERLIVLRTEDGRPVEPLEPIMDVFEGSTYTNRSNLAPDFIQTLESVYQGQMRDRFLLGKWAAYEGLVYPQYDPAIHLRTFDEVMSYFMGLLADGYMPEIVEAFDHGIAKPSCYLFAFIDPYGNVIVADGFYRAEMSIEERAKEIQRIRSEWVRDLMGPREFSPILADPSIFKRTAGQHRTVGVSVAGMFASDYGIHMTRANNDILNGIVKVQTYLQVREARRDPFTHNFGAAHLYFSDRCAFVDREIVDYYWERDKHDQNDDKPMDRNDHAMDALKYLLTNKPRIGGALRSTRSMVPAYMTWAEAERVAKRSSHRYG